MPAMRVFGGFAEKFLELTGWIDSLQLAANTAKSYTIPIPAGATVPARILRVSGTVTKANSTTDVYFNPYGVAVVPTADVLDGTASMLVESDPFIIAVPQGCTAISFLSTAAGTLTIEAWS